jgi:hypothetical protein
VHPRECRQKLRPVLPPELQLIHQLQHLLSVRPRYRVNYPQFFRLICQPSRHRLPHQDPLPYE